jgi:hypothetical protein
MRAAERVSSTNQALNRRLPAVTLL